MRIVGGRFSGRPLATRRGAATRPTAERVRQAIFNILDHGIEGLELEGARVLDLFAGSGALGLEALSRGAAHVLFVEEAAEARGALRANAEALGVLGLTKIWRRDATKLGRAAPQPPFDLAFADPPYGRHLGEKALAALIAGEWLKAGAVVVLEEAERAEVKVPAGLSLIDRRVYGDTQVLFLRAQTKVGAVSSSSSSDEEALGL
jgi:16S rRNA (guanine966-N2)-methyltransferase